MLREELWVALDEILELDLQLEHLGIKNDFAELVQGLEGGALNPFQEIGAEVFVDLFHYVFCEILGNLLCLLSVDVILDFVYEVFGEILGGLLLLLSVDVIVDFVYQVSCEILGDLLYPLRVDVIWDLIYFFKNDILLLSLLKDVFNLLLFTDLFSTILIPLLLNLHQGLFFELLNQLLCIIMKQLVDFLIARPHCRIREHLEINQLHFRNFVNEVLHFVNTGLVLTVGLAFTTQIEFDILEGFFVLYQLLPGNILEVVEVLRGLILSFELGQP